MLHISDFYIIKSLYAFLFWLKGHKIFLSENILKLRLNSVFILHFEIEFQFQIQIILNCKQFSLEKLLQLQMFCNCKRFPLERLLTIAKLYNTAVKTFDNIAVKTTG